MYEQPVCQYRLELWTQQHHSPRQLLQFIGIMLQQTERYHRLLGDLYLLDRALFVRSVFLFPFFLGSF